MRTRPIHGYVVPLIVFVVGAATLVSTPALAATTIPPRAASAAPTTAATQDCATLQARASTLAAQGAKSGGCVEAESSTAAAKARAKATATKGVAAPNAVSRCYLDYGTRQHACDYSYAVYKLFLLPEMTLIGEIHHEVVTEVTLSGRSSRWTHRFEYAPVYSWGPVGDVLMIADAKCMAGCLPVGGTFASGSAVLAFGLTGTATFETTYGGPGAAWQSWSAWSWYFFNAVAVPPTTDSLTNYMVPHRCDDALGLTTPVGCAYPQVQPRLDIPRLRYPTYARHIELSLNFGLRSVLTRTTNAAVNDANRNTACPTGPSYPRPAGFTCDEYPFASTYDGAAAQPYGRQFIIIAPSQLAPARSAGRRWRGGNRCRNRRYDRRGPSVAVVAAVPEPAVTAAMAVPVEPAIAPAAAVDGGTNRESGHTAGNGDEHHGRDSTRDSRAGRGVDEATPSAALTAGGHARGRFFGTRRVSAHRGRLCTPS